MVVDGQEICQNLSNPPWSSPWILLAVRRSSWKGLSFMLSCQASHRKVESRKYIDIDDTTPIERVMNSIHGYMIYDLSPGAIYIFQVVPKAGRYLTYCKTRPGLFLAATCKPRRRKWWKGRGGRKYFKKLPVSRKRRGGLWNNTYPIETLEIMVYIFIQ